MKKLIMKLMAWLTKNRGVQANVPSVEPEPEPEHEQIPDVPDVPCASLPITATISNVKIGKHGVAWSITPIPDWPTKEVKKLCQGITLLYVASGGSWKGGKFDWFKAGNPPQTSKDWKNVEAGYMGIIPVAGDRVAFGLTSVDGKQRSNFVEARWP